MKLTISVVLSYLALSALPGHAHVGRGFSVPDLQHAQNELVARGREAYLKARDSPKNAADMAKIKDASAQCDDYGLPSSEQLSKKYPGAGVAEIVDGDDEARQIWDEIRKSDMIPDDVEEREGTKHHYGITDDSSDSYNDGKDPDCWWTATGCTEPKHKNIGPDVKECSEPSTWGLTFDDGPNCSHNAFYDFLRDKNLKATMFYIGTNVLDLPLQAQRGLADGHDICVHTWSHRYMTTLSNEQVFAELYYTMRIIKDVTGVTTRCWRPPFGDVDDRVRAIAAGLGLRTILWSDDTDDWNIIPDGKSPTSKIESNYEKIINKQKDDKLDGKGVIVLTHELTKNTMGQFQMQYDKIRDAYEHIVPLTACLNVTHPYVEDNVTYPVFNDFVEGGKPKGLPQLDDMPAISIASKLDITPEHKQTGEGGFSSKSKPASQNSNNSKSSQSQDKSKDDEGDSDNNSGDALATRALSVLVSIGLTLAAVML